MMRSYIDTLDLSLGMSIRDNCPMCGGYKTLSVSNLDGFVVWNCYKARCNSRGTTKVNLSVDDIRNRLLRKSVTTSTFVLPDHFVSVDRSAKATTWLTGWGIEQHKSLFRYDILEHRVVFPIKHGDQIVDATGRSIGNRVPKWKRYGKSPLPFVHGGGSVAVVVEDCVSAVVVGTQERVGVSLMGTSLSSDHMKYLSQYDTVIIALDPDAMPKSLAIAKDLRLHVNTVKVLNLNDDLKYRNSDDVAALENM